CVGPRLVRPRPDGSPAAWPAAVARRGPGAGRGGGLRNTSPGGCRLGHPRRRRRQRRGPRGLGRQAARRRPRGVRPRRRRDARLPDRRAGDALGEERRRAAVLLRGDDRALRGARGRPRGDPRGGRGGVTDEEPSGLSMEDVLSAAAEDLADVRRTEDGEVVIWLVGDVPFSVLTAAR